MTDDDKEHQSALIAHVLSLNPNPPSHSELAWLRLEDKWQPVQVQSIRVQSLAEKLVAPYNPTAYILKKAKKEGKKEVLLGSLWCRTDRECSWKYGMNVFIEGEHLLNRNFTFGLYENIKKSHTLNETPERK